MTSTITDRVATNHATHVLIQDDFDNDLIELKCNVHPLDGTSNKASTVGRAIDQTNGTTGQCFGTEGSATNLVKVCAIAYCATFCGTCVGACDFKCF